MNYAYLDASNSIDASIGSTGDDDVLSDEGKAPMPADSIISIEPSMKDSNAGVEVVQIDGGSIGASGDVNALPSALSSSFHACLCWKSGENCSLPGGPILPTNPAMACPDNEFCDGDSTHSHPDKTVTGTCRKTCFLASATVTTQNDCASQEVCQLVKIKSGFEGQTIVTVAMCFEDAKPLGRDQSATTEPGK